MGAALDQQTLAEVLPGTWRIAATNFPMWLSGDRLDPRLTYGLVSRDPLVLSDDVSYTAGGDEPAEKHVLGRDAWRGAEFVWRGRRLLRLVASRWRVAGLSDDGAIAAIVFSKSLVTPAGVDILVREGSEHAEVRATIAHATEEFGLTPEQFGSLTWLPAGVTGR